MKRMLNVLALLGVFIAGSIGAQLGIDKARAAFWQWSQSASLNGNSDPSINWAEGMPPSVVNDSARAMMAALATQAADTSGGLVTAGGPTAYTVATNQGFPNPPLDGQLLAVTFNVTNGANPTLTVDGAGPSAIVAAAGSFVQPGGLQAGMPYTLSYSLANNWWRLRDVTGSGGVPIGSVIAYTGATTPSSSWVFADGQCLSTTTYATYWALVGSPGIGYCAAGQFPVIDLRGRVPAGVDTSPYTGAASRLTSAASGCGSAITFVGAACVNGLESRTMTVLQMPQHAHSAPLHDPGHSHTLSFDDTHSIAQTDVTGYQTVSNTLTGTTSTAYTGIYANGNGGPGGAIGYTDFAGSSQPHPAVQPTLGVNYIIKVM